MELYTAANRLKLVLPVERESEAEMLMAFVRGALGTGPLPACELGVSLPPACPAPSTTRLALPVSLGVACA